MPSQRESSQQKDIAGTTTLQLSQSSGESRDMVSQPPVSMAPQAPNETWAGAISRLQTQVSYNTSMHESHRRQVGEIEQAVGRLQQEMVGVITVLTEIRADMRGRPTNAEPARTDPGDLDLLASQILSLTTKTNEVDNIKMQIELLKNRMKRLEEHGSPAVPHLRPRTGSAQREHYDQNPAGTAAAGPPLPPPLPHHGQPLPPMRTSASAPNASPRDDRAPNFNGVPPAGLNSQSTVSIRAAPSPRSQNSDAHPQSAPLPIPGFRPADSLPPPPAISGWRSAEGFPPSASANSSSTPTANAPPPPASSRPLPAIEPETQSSGWASVNANHPPKRPYDDSRPPQYEPPSLPGSPKRPKLAPIMPRNSYPEEGHPHPHPHPHPPPHPHAHAPPPPPPPPPPGLVHHPSHDGHYHHAPRTASDEPHPGGQAFRFVTSTSDGQEAWLAEQERMMANHHREMMNHDRGRGRGRGGRGGRGRGRGGRGGGIIMQTHDGSEMASPEWGPPHGGSPNGFYHPVHPHSPQAGVLRRIGGLPGEMPIHDFPATPIHVHDPFAVQDSSLSSGKKSRTKPFRNAEGILIRKDGRPDMRSVSSANNLRKVHAKKELERAEMEGRTPTSARSLAPAHSLSEDGDDPRSHSPASHAGMEEPHDDDEVGVEDGMEGNTHEHTGLNGDLKNGIATTGADEGRRSVMADAIHDHKASAAGYARRRADSDVDMKNHGEAAGAPTQIARPAESGEKNTTSKDTVMSDASITTVGDNQSTPHVNGESQQEKQAQLAAPATSKDSEAENIPPIATAGAA